jgi:tripartite-type tricarboxylate transporter receptor subunit TctC
MTALRWILWLGLALCGPAAAQPYPDRAVTLVVPYPANGPLDTLARTMVVAMGKHLHQPVLIENIAGAGGTVGTAQVAQADPDGYTVLITHLGMAASPSLYLDLPYDVQRDFEPVGEITDLPMAIVSRGDFPARSFPELLAHLRANKGRVRLANAGPGSASHLCAMMFTAATGAEVHTVVYKGTGPAMDDLLSGKVDLLCDMTTTATPHILAGRLKAFGVTTPHRLPSLPHLPTLQESGLKGFSYSAWHALFLPRGTPRPVVDKVVEALQAALQDPGVKLLFKDLGTEPAPLAKASPQYLRQHLGDEIERWAAVIRRAGEHASVARAN